MYDTAYDKAQSMFMDFINFPALLYYTLKENHKELSEAIPYFRSYTSPGDFHTMIRFDQLYTVEVAGVRLVDWVRDLAEGKYVKNIDCGNVHESR